MAKKKPKPASPFLGRWHIVSMSAWDEDYLKEEFERVRKEDTFSISTRDTVERCYQIIAAGRVQIEQLDVQLTDSH